MNWLTDIQWSMILWIHVVNRDVGARKKQQNYFFFLEKIVFDHIKKN